MHGCKYKYQKVSFIQWRSTNRSLPVTFQFLQELSSFFLSRCDYPTWPIYTRVSFVPIQEETRLILRCSFYLWHYLVDIVDVHIYIDFHRFVIFIFLLFFFDRLSFSIFSRLPAPKIILDRLIQLRLRHEPFLLIRIVYLTLMNHRIVPHSFDVAPLQILIKQRRNDRLFFLVILHLHQFFKQLVSWLNDFLLGLLLFLICLDLRHFFLEVRTCGLLFLVSHGQVVLI